MAGVRLLQRNWWDFAVEDVPAISSYHFASSRGSLRLCVISDTTTSVRNPSGIVTMPGWLNGTMAGVFSTSRP